MSTPEKLREDEFPAFLDGISIPSAPPHAEDKYYIKWAECDLDDVLDRIRQRLGQPLGLPLLYSNPSNSRLENLINEIVQLVSYNWTFDARPYLIDFLKKKYGDKLYF